jgi:peptidoglycan/xylan/chitin deacetylase (PgdA/CDA1 family)
MEEVAGSKRALEDLLGRRVGTFAYPYGAWSAQIADCVAATGFDSAWTTRPGRVSGRPLLFLPRFMMPPRASFTSVRAAFGRALPALHWALATVERSRGRQPRYERYDPDTRCSSFVVDSADAVVQTRSRPGTG